MAEATSSSTQVDLVAPNRLQEIQTLLDRLIQQDTSDAAIEIEARFGEFVGSQFTSGVDARTFVRLRDAILRQNPRTRLGGRYTVTRTRDDVYRDISSNERERFTTTFDTTGSPQQRYRLVKTRIENFDFPQHFFRIGVSREQSDQTPPPIGRPRLTRDKVRWSVEWSGRNFMAELRRPADERRFRLDLTEVTTYYPEDGNPLRANTVYEIEIEVLSPKRENLIYFRGAIQNILREVLGTILIYTAEEKLQVIAAFNAALGSRNPRPGEVDIRLISQARNLKARDLVEGGIVPKTNAGIRYSVTIKADGTRRFLFIDRTGVYLIGPPSDVMMLMGPADANRLQTWFGTIIEGELIPEENLSPTAPAGYHRLLVYFLMYDTLAVSQKRGDSSAADTSVQSWSHASRLQYIERFERIAYGLAYNRDTGQLKPGTMLFTMKPVHLFTNRDEFYQMVQLTLDTTYYFRTDGIIFTPDNYPYDPSVSELPLPDRKLTRRPDIVKWKPLDQLTIDFEIRHIAVSPTAAQPWTGPGIELLSGVSNRWDPRRIQSLDRLYRDQIQQGFNGSRMAFQGSSGHLFNASTDLIMTDLVRSAPNGTIMEFRWTPVPGDRIPGTEADVPEGARGQLEALRARADKIYPNSLDVALDVWEDIHSPLTLEVMRGTRFGLVFRYHNREKWALFNAVSQRANPKVLLDVGSGKGGDVYKWVESGFTHVICVEPNEENRIELQRRLSETDIQFRILPTVGQDVEQIVRAVQEFSPTRMVHAVSYMLSLSFFFDQASSVASIVQIVDRTLVNGGHFIAFTIDGRYVREYFNNLQNRTNYNNVLRSRFEMIQFELRPPLPSVPVENIYIDIPGTIVRHQVEYLTDLPELRRLFGTIGLELISESRANKEKFMTREELTFSSFFTSILYRRSSQPRPTASPAWSVQTPNVSATQQIQTSSPVRTVQTPTTSPTQQIQTPTTSPAIRPTPVAYETAAILLQSGRMRSFRAAPNQVGAGTGNTRLILVDQTGQEYEVVASYDSVTNSISRPVLTYETAIAALQNRQIVNFRTDPNNQQGLSQGNTRITLIAADGREYDLVARFDPTTNNILPPLG